MGEIQNLYLGGGGGRGRTIGNQGEMTTSGSGKKKKKTYDEEEAERAERMGASRSPGGTIWINNMRPGFDFVGSAIDKEKRGSNIPESMREADAMRREAEYQANVEKDHAKTRAMQEEARSKLPINESEVNPQVRTDFEARQQGGITALTNQATNPTINDLQKQNWIQKLESSQFGKTINSIKDINDAVLGGAFIGGVALLTIAVPPAGIALSGIIGADMLTNWAALDNTIGQSAIMTSRLVSDMGSLTPEQRSQSIITAETAYTNAQVAQAKITTSTMINPATWPFRKLWNTSAKNSMMQIENNLALLKNYNPNMDPYSTEMKLQTYGKPKHDSQGNPL